MPEVVKLHDNYPNPFNNTTKIRYDLVRPINVSLVIFDIRGTRVKTIYNHIRQNPGNHSYIWDGTNEEGNVVSSGIYLYRLEAGSYGVTKKITLLR